MRDQLLHLVHHAVVNLLTLVLFDILSLAVIDAHQVIPQSWDHKELLHHTVHVTDATEVAKTDILLVAFRLNLWHIIPVLGLLDSQNQRHKV